MSQYPEYDDKAGADNYGSKFPVTTLTARVVAVLCLIVSAVVTKTNDLTIETGYVYTYKDFRSYKYMLYVAIIGVCYTFLQLPFAVYYMKKKKHLINSYTFLQFNFYIDMIMTVVVATGVGAGFGATLDMKKWSPEDAKIQDFFTMSYIPAAFLLLGCIASGISTVHSSLALQAKN